MTCDPLSSLRQGLFLMLLGFNHWLTSLSYICFYHQTSLSVLPEINSCTSLLYLSLSSFHQLPNGRFLNLISARPSPRLLREPRGCYLFTGITLSVYNIASCNLWCNPHFSKTNGKIFVYIIELKDFENFLLFTAVK